MFFTLRQIMPYDNVYIDGFICLRNLEDHICLKESICKETCSVSDMAIVRIHTFMPETPLFIVYADA